jgi:hypothetical protein
VGGPAGHPGGKIPKGEHSAAAGIGAGDGTFEEHPVTHVVSRDSHVNLGGFWGVGIY